MIHDRHQAAMIGALVQGLGPAWTSTLEVAVHEPVRGVIDAVLERPIARRHPGGGGRVRAASPRAAGAVGIRRIGRAGAGAKRAGRDGVAALPSPIDRHHAVDRSHLRGCPGRRVPRAGGGRTGRADRPCPLTEPRDRRGFGPTRTIGDRTSRTSAPPSAVDRLRSIVYSHPLTSNRKEFSRLMVRTDRSRKLVAIAIRADGSRVPVRLPDPAEVSILAKLELVGLGLLALLTGSRRESGGRRR